LPDIGMATKWVHWRIAFDQVFSAVEPVSEVLTVDAQPRYYRAPVKHPNVSLG